MSELLFAIMPLRCQVLIVVFVSSVPGEDLLYYFLDCSDAGRLISPSNRSKLRFSGLWYLVSKYTASFHRRPQSYHTYSLLWETEISHSDRPELVSTERRAHAATSPSLFVGGQSSQPRQAALLSPGSLSLLIHAWSFTKYVIVLLNCNCGDSSLSRKAKLHHRLLWKWNSSLLITVAVCVDDFKVFV
jgi:hypothetical protein